MLCGRSKVKAAARPLPKVLVTTAGHVVGVVALLYRVASDVAPLSVYLSATPWNWRVWLTMPLLIGFDALTSRYPSFVVPPAGVSPKTVANCESGRNAMSVPPLLT